MLWTSVLMSGVMCVVYFVAGAWIMGILFILFTVCAYLYSGAVKERIPFASSNLRTACIGVKHFSPKLPLVASGALVAQVSGWRVCCCDFLILPIPFYCFLLLPIATSVSCPCLDAPCTRSSKLPPSPAFPAVSRFI